MDCLIEGARTLVSADSYRDRRTLMKQVAEDALARRCLDGSYFVSKAWYEKSFCCFKTFYGKLILIQSTILPRAFLTSKLN